tara:strand:+ start:499 stop:2055 length:1557 start_codon:yes stop_codon:yes gene_type:complete
MDKKSKSILQYKIKNANEVADIIGFFPRKNKVILCHGTFDIVHPGHIRHLLHAKTQCQTLVVSITSDNYNSKTKYRPFVPESLRAYNIAALEVVDYVIIDNNEKPLELINYLKPDYFAKGYEYNAEDKVHHKTKEELKVVEKYGGEVVFTPGDIVYSSSNIIENSAPNLSIEKLHLLMNAEEISFKEIKNTLNSLQNISVHIIGDTIVDSYTNCSMIGGMTKTPTMSLKFQSKSDFTGGAAIVAKHLKAAGAKVKFTTLLGNDSHGKCVLDDLRSQDIKVNSIIDADRPTTNKNAIVCNNYRLLKIDTLENKIISERILRKFCDFIKNDSSQVTILSDFRHGIFNKTTIPEICRSINKKSFKVADSQVASRWGNITEFKDFHLITPNEKEARFALGDQDSHIRPLASQLYKESSCKLLILKLGDKGIIALRNKDEDDPRRLVSLDSFTENPIDPVGAGDALLAYSSLSMADSKNEVISIILGNIAAGLACEEDGNIAITTDKILQKLEEIENIVNFKN